MKNFILIVCAIVLVGACVLAVIAFSNSNNAVANSNGTATPAPAPAVQVYNNGLPGCKPGELLYGDKICQINLDPAADRIINIAGGK